MPWQRSCTKENGSLRKQFLQWQVPKETLIYYYHIDLA